MNLEQLKEYFEQVAGEWNGDESGIQEDRANIANDALDAIKVVENALSEL